MAQGDDRTAMSHIERIEAVKGFWNEQAQQHSVDLAATTPDPIAKDLEIKVLLRHLDPQRDTLEVGCGNGTNILRLAGHLRGRILGIDYAERMVEAARLALATCPGNEAGRIRFDGGDILQSLARFGRFPQIFTVRCLINLPTLEHQLAALANLASALVPGGRLILIESVRQGQERMNALREAVGLAPIPYHWHNCYLDQEAFLARIPPRLKLVEIDPFASLYFVVSRVFNAKLTPPGQSPDYLAEINKIAAELPSIGDHGPLKLFLFETRSSA
jgi:SAM-dependent methyltransferase